MSFISINLTYNYIQYVLSNYLTKKRLLYTIKAYSEQGVLLSELGKILRKRKMNNYQKKKPEKNYSKVLKIASIRSKSSISRNLIRY